MTEQQPAAPDPDRREYLLGVLAELIAHDGPAPLLAPPVVPGAAAFPEPWQPTRGGAAALLRRLAWHAGQPRAIAVIDRRRPALVTERKPETHLELTEVGKQRLALELAYIGEDDVAGTFAHEIGVAHAVVSRIDPSDPYRTADPSVLAVDPDRDLERGSIATVYLGLGVLAANAAYQQYSRPATFTGGNTPVDYDVVRAGYVAMSDLAYLIAVQAVVRGHGAPPPGLSPPQRDEVSAWLAVLRERPAELRERLAIPAEVPIGTERPRPEPFTDVELDDPEPEQRPAFRWHMHRRLFAFTVSALAGLAGLAVVSALAPALGPIAAGGALVASVAGLVIGGRTWIARCSACATIVDARAERCHRCEATFHGDINSLAERLEAEERLDERSPRRERERDAG